MRRLVIAVVAVVMMLLLISCGAAMCPAYDGVRQPDYESK